MRSDHNSGKFCNNSEIRVTNRARQRLYFNAHIPGGDRTDFRVPVPYNYQIQKSGAATESWRSESCARLL